MGYTDFIAAVDLGTSWLTGMVGKKNASGTLVVIAAEMEPADGCIRRGCVYNVEETAARISKLIRKMNSKLDGSKISKVYIGVGGQSIRLIDHTINRELRNEGVVTNEIVNALNEEAGKFRPILADVLTIASPVWTLDGRQVANPVGVPCGKMEANYKLIVARPSLRRYVRTAVADKSKLEIADILVSPLALADVVLGKDEKELGCALVDFGAGVTKVAIYKGGRLRSLHVIPLGGNVVTKDITSLQIVESEAERLKKEYGSATVDPDNSGDVQLFSSDGIMQSSVRQMELDMVIEARIREIIENVVSRLETTLPLQELGCGILITGGASELKGLRRTLSERTGLDVKYARLRKGVLDDGTALEDHPGYLSAVGLLMQGKVNCSDVVIPPVTAPLFGTEDVPAEPTKATPPPVEPVAKPKDEKGQKEPKKKSFIDKFKNMGQTLFDDGEF